MRVRPRVIDLGWGELKTAVVAANDARLLAQYGAAFRKVESGQDGEARGALRQLSGSISTQLPDGQRATLHTLIETQLSKLT